jgi:hypothetical protein
MGRLPRAFPISFCPEVFMSRPAFLAVAFALAVLAPVHAQTLTAAQRAACQADYDKFCKGTMPGGGSIIACLNKNYAQLADACKKVVDAQKK